MAQIEQVADLICECLQRCQNSGFTLATLVQFLDELRANGQSEVDVQFVDSCMRYLMREIL